MSPTAQDNPDYSFGSSATQPVNIPPSFGFGDAVAANTNLLSADYAVQQTGSIVVSLAVHFTGTAPALQVTLSAGGQRFNVDGVPAALVNDTLYQFAVLVASGDHFNVRLTQDTTIDALELAFATVLPIGR